MAFTIPDFRTILTRVQTDLGGFSDGTVPRRSVEYVLARAMARLAKGLYGYQTWILKQIFPDTADDLYFWRFANRFGIDQKQAVSWQGTFTFTGTSGAVIPLGTELQRADCELYTTVAAVSIVGIGTGTATAALIATTAGLDPSCEDGQELSLASPIVGVATEGFVITTSTPGSDVESKDEALVRLLQRLATPPRGGGPGDYVRWALEVPGVTRAWEFPLLEAPNSVSVAFARDNDVSPVPGVGDRATVLAYLQTKAPITVDVRVVTLVASALNITLTALDPNTPTVKDAIETSVAALLLREAEPGGTLALSRIDEAVSAGAGESSHIMSVPSAAVTWTTAQLPVMGTVTGP